MKGSNTQSTLLASAGQRDSGSLYPLPETITHKAGATKSITAIAKHGLNRITSGDELKRRKGEGGRARDRRGISAG